MNDEQSQQRITGLEQTVQSLTQRVYRLEQAVTELSVDALRETPRRAGAGAVTARVGAGVAAGAGAGVTAVVGL